MVNCASGTFLKEKKIVPKTAIELLHEQIFSLLKSNDYNPSSILFPAIVPEDVAKRAISALLAGNNILFYGPPGTGKSLTATVIRRQIFNFPNRWVVAYKSNNSEDTQSREYKLPSGKKIKIKGVCPVGCHPASLYDPKFREKIEPCPICKIEYSKGNIQSIGDFPIIKPEDVFALNIKIRDGYGTKRIQCSPEATPEKLVGRLNIQKYLHDTEIGGDPSDPRVFDPGDLLQSFLISHLDEICKLPVASQQTLLQATEERELNPSGIKMPFPRKAIDVATSNEEDLSRIIQPLNDRFINIFFPYESESGLTDEKDIESILKYGLNNEYTQDQKDPAFVEIPSGPSFCNKPISRHSIFPTYLQKTITEAIRIYRNQEIWKKVKESGSHRVMIDTAINSMSHAALRMKNLISIANIEDLVFAFDLAITGRIRGYENELEELCDGIKQGIRRINLNQLALENLKKYVCNFVVEKGSVIAKNSLDEIEPLFIDKKSLEVLNDIEIINRAELLKLINSSKNPFIEYIIQNEKIPTTIDKKIEYELKTNLIASIGSVIFRNGVLDSLCD
ncbi:MAG: hypothetical protein ACTSUV_07170 [Candidatus Ranarchaeia archaeon]